MINFKNHIKKNIFYIIRDSAKYLKIKCFVIGGYVRNFIIKNYYNIIIEEEKEDIDILVLGDELKIAKKVAEKIKFKKKIIIYKNYKTILLSYKNKKIEFVSARKESYNYNSRNPIVKNGNFKDDQNRRDFTINSLSISLNENNYGKLIDPFNGIEDIKKKIIRTPLDPNITYSDDPLRMIRAIRFSSQFNFYIEKNSFFSIINNKNRISIVPIERIMEEFKKIILSKYPSIGIKLLFKSKLLYKFLPEVYNLSGIEEIHGKKHKDNFLHTLEVLENISKRTSSLWLRLAALLHDIGKTVTKKYHHKYGWTFYSHEYIGSKMIPKIFKRLKLPLGEKMKYVKKIIKYSSRPISLIKENITDSAIRRFLLEIGDNLEDLILLCKSDITTKNLEKQKKYSKNFDLVLEKIKKIKKKDKIRNWKSPISGYQIMDIFNITPCKKIGIIKSKIKEAIINGIIENEKKDILFFLEKIGNKLGLIINKSKYNNFFYEKK
ncbi:HD domain-containing protein [Candidatus Shikimatogenerans silvanidophilus]|uniref:HD domain-containing protein n=1 Tax=Candidatus Shikimatogenerans silvanidophilus TaxID=2782547 RepID=UPI001BA85E5B|nr:HD domain-containing protein [Candidatus Shikimatogenerans silvanidophilus]